MFRALAADGNPKLIAAFMETKTRQIEHWATALGAENALLHQALERGTPVQPACMASSVLWYLSRAGH